MAASLRDGREGRDRRVVLPPIILLFPHEWTRVEHGDGKVAVVTGFVLEICFALDGF